MAEKIVNGFCFCKGEMVDCKPGRIQDCNLKRLSKCPKLEMEEKKENGFCFCKGQMVSCSLGRIQDCNMKRVNVCPLGL